jgi:hypothetical protein
MNSTKTSKFTQNKVLNNTPNSTAASTDSKSHDPLPMPIWLLINKPVILSDTFFECPPIRNSLFPQLTYQKMIPF